MIEKNYGIFNFNFIDKIIVKKRSEMFKILEQNISNVTLKSILDVGTIDNDSLKSSNFFANKFKDVSIRKSISNQIIDDKKFSMRVNKSITSDFSNEELDKLKADLVLSSATIEHVGNYQNQKKMIENIMDLSTKFFFITTPNRHFPIDFHTKLPFLHMLPKKIHRLILKIIGLKEYGKEENLNLIDEKTIKKLIIGLKKNNFNIQIFKIKLLSLTSNIIILGKNKNL